MPLSDQLSIRPASDADLDRLVALEAAIFPSPWSRDALAAELVPSNSAAAEPSAAQPSAAEVSPAEVSPEPANPAAARLMLVGRSCGGIVGYALFHRVLDECELLRLAVSTRNRGQGFGAALLTAGLDKMSSQGVIACRLEVGAENTAAIRLYKRFGFVEEGRRKAYYRHGEDALLLVLKPISRA